MKIKLKHFSIAALVGAGGYVLYRKRKNEKIKQTEMDRLLAHYNEMHQSTSIFPKEKRKIK